MGKGIFCRRPVKGDSTLCYKRSEERKEKKFSKYGKTKCKKCGTLIYADKKYRWECYKKCVR